MVSLVGFFATQRFALRDQLTITVDGTGEEIRGALVIVGNTTPMTYMGRIPVHFMPDCTFESGLDLLAPGRANAFFAMRNMAQALGLGRARRLLVNPDKAQVRHDLPGFTVTCDEAQPLQADGEYLGDRTHIRFSLLERTIDLIA